MVGPLQGPPCKPASLSQPRFCLNHGPKPEWEIATINSSAVGKGDPRVRCNHCLKEYDSGCTRIRGHLLTNPKSGVSMCDKCPPAVRSMMAGKEEEAAAEKKASCKAQMQEASAAAGGLPARPVQQTIAICIIIN